MPKTNQINRTLPLIILLIVNLLVFCLILHLLEKNEDSKQIDRTIALLEKMHIENDLNKILEPALKELFDLIYKKDVTAANQLILEWSKEKELLTTDFEVLAFENGHLLTPTLENKEEFEMLLQSIIMGNLPEKDSDHHHNRMLNLLNGGIGYELLQHNQQRLQKINNAEKRSYAAWFTQPDAQEKGIDSIIVFIHESVLDRDYLSKRVIERFSIGSLKNTLGYIDLVVTNHSVIPSNLQLEELLSELKNKKNNIAKPIIKIGNQELIVSKKENGKLFFAIYKTKAFETPPWLLALLFAWILPYKLICGVKKEEGWFSLSLLTNGIFAISILLPSIAGIAYLTNFKNIKRQALQMKVSEKQQNYLIGLDKSFAEIFKLNQRRYDEITAILDKKPTSLQAFIDASVKAEIDGLFDTCLLVDEKGRMARPYSGVANLARQIAFYKDDFKKEIIRIFESMGWQISEEERSFIVEVPEQGWSASEFTKFNPYRSNLAITGIARISGNGVIRGYNTDMGFPTHSGDKEISNILMNAMIEGEGEDILAKMRYSIKDFVEFGLGGSRLTSYVDVARDSTGKAVYCIIYHSVHHTHSTNHMYSIFSPRAIYPFGVKYFSISSLPLRKSFPTIHYYDKFNFLFDELRPPQNIIEKKVRINDEPYLLKAYRGKKSSERVFGALTPLSFVEEMLEPIGTKIFVAALIVLLTSLYVYKKLQSGILEPASKIMNGVTAIKESNHSYRISMERNDEWQALANTFNEVLEGMKDLEIATFVQTSILPSDLIENSFSGFYGKTFSADEVGGDYFDLFKVNDDEIIFVIGDVSGHSVASALVVAMVRAAFVAWIDLGITEPDCLCNKTNKFLLEQFNRLKVMSCFVGHLTSRGTLTFCNAGQSFPYLVDFCGKVSTIRQVGYPLGSSKSKNYASKKIQLLDNSRLIMFTDGLVEAADTQQQPFGYTRLENLIRKIPLNTSKSEFIDNLIDELKSFSSASQWSDDITIALIDYKK